MHIRNFQILSLIVFMAYCTCQQSISEINQLIRRPNQDNSDTRPVSDQYFLDYLKKYEVHIKQAPTATTSSEETSQVQLKKILTEERLEKMENRMLGEIRKVNLKLMRLEDNLKNLTNKIGDLIKIEMNTIKDEVMRSLSEKLNRN